MAKRKPMTPAQTKRIVRKVREKLPKSVTTADLLEVRPCVDLMAIAITLAPKRLRQVVIDTTVTLLKETGRL